MDIKEKENLRAWSWWKVGGVADYFCQPSNKEELQEALSWAKNKKLPFSVLGGGTNVLISDEGVEGLVICTRQLNQVDFKQEDHHLKIRAESGVPKSQLMLVFKKHKLIPALFLTGLPGDVGGGIVMNAGVGSQNRKPTEFSEIVDWFDVVTFEGIHRYHKKDVDWEYRKTSGWKKGVILEAQLSWGMEQEVDLNQYIKTELKKRRKTQPLDWPSCGSVFKNPHSQYAGQLIEKSGLKGIQKGGAVISEKHCNFIINKGQATAKDINELIQNIRKTVCDKFDILLEPEIHYVGRWKDLPYEK
ncbi:MAG: UDP-N-acetylmuramate dehydrogenase [Bdellovibrionales bacterium]